MASETKKPEADLVSELLDDVARQSANGDLGGFSATITKALAPPKAIHAVAASGSFWQHLTALLDNVPTHNDQAVAFALAEIGRLSGALKPKTDRLGTLASDLLKRRTPPHFCHGDADATTFAAKGWACSDHPVDVAIATRTAVMADAPKPLIPWLELALSAGEPSSMIEHLASALDEHSASESKSPKNRSPPLKTPRWTR